MTAMTPAELTARLQNQPSAHTSSVLEALLSFPPSSPVDRVLQLLARDHSEGLTLPIPVNREHLALLRRNAVVGDEERLWMLMEPLAPRKGGPQGELDLLLREWVCLDGTGIVYVDEDRFWQECGPLNVVFEPAEDPNPLPLT